MPHWLPILQGNRAKQVCGATSDQSPYHPYPTQPSRTFISVTEVRSPDWGSEQLKPPSLDVEDTEGSHLRYRESKAAGMAGDSLRDVI